MAHHKSALKRIRSSEKRRLHNRYYLKTTRTFMKRLRQAANAEEATSLLPKVTAMLDKLAKRNIIHKNNASNKKSKLARLVAKMQAA